ncbi:MAG: hypothetical protein JXA69_17375 [Phycisphaerae bacterium]|nr:hypothetical protein [Phycisphaerae bacterium]
MSTSMNRREFLGTAAAGAAAAMLQTPRTAFAAGAPAASRQAWKIHTVFVGRSGGAWPKPAFDPKAEVAMFRKHLDEAERSLGDVQFVGHELVQTPQQAAEVAASLGDASGLLLFHLSIGTRGEMRTLVDAGLPTVVFSQPFSGHDWMDVNRWRKAGSRVTVFATRDFGEIAMAAALLRVPGQMKHTRILAVPGPLAGTAPAQDPEQVKARLGAQVVAVSYDRLIEAHRAVDPAKAEAEAQTCWLSQARTIVEPSREEIVKSARMYLAMQQVMHEEKAQAITINCLGGLPIDVLGYPCLAHSKLCDQGMVGACEADIDSTLTMLLFRYAFGVPGFITDPFFDTAKNAVIHAHCTAPTRMDGPGGQRAPFDIRTHTDDDKGAALDVQMRVGQAITCAKLVNLDTMLLSTGKIIEIPDFQDRGCRTQITTEVKNAGAMLENWGAGLLDSYGWMAELHRVVFYGDYVQPTRHMGHLMGFKVVDAI